MMTKSHGLGVIPGRDPEVDPLLRQISYWVAERTGFYPIIIEEIFTANHLKGRNGK
jgi:hypothetical protein